MEPYHNYGREKSDCQQLPVCDEALIFWCSVTFCLLTLSWRATAESSNQMQPPVITVIQREVQSLEAGSSTPAVNLVQLKENTNMAGRRQIRHEQMFHIKWVKGPCWKLQGLLRKATNPIMEVIGLRESSLLGIHRESPRMWTPWWEQAPSWTRFSSTALSGRSSQSHELETALLEM